MGTSQTPTAVVCLSARHWSKLLSGPVPATNSNCWVSSENLKLKWLQSLHWLYHKIRCSLWGLLGKSHWALARYMYNFPVKYWISKLDLLVFATQPCNVYGGGKLILEVGAVNVDHSEEKVLGVWLYIGYIFMLVWFLSQNWNSCVTVPFFLPNGLHSMQLQTLNFVYSCCWCG